MVKPIRYMRGASQLWKIDHCLDLQCQRTIVPMNIDHHWRYLDVHPQLVTGELTMLEVNITHLGYVASHH